MNLCSTDDERCIPAIEKNQGKMGFLPNRIGRLIVRKQTIVRNKLGERICFDATSIARDSA